MIIRGWYDGSGDSIEVSFAVISSREGGIMDCPEEEEAHFDEKVNLPLVCAGVGGGVMLVCCHYESDHRVPGDISKA